MAVVARRNWGYHRQTGVGAWVAAGQRLASGMLHPIGGWDHLLAMVAVGVLSTKLGRRAIWGLPLIFVASMAAGYLAGLWGVALDGTEWGVMLSVVVLGLQVALSDRINQKWTGGNGLIVMLFGLCHGYAHGVVGAALVDHTPGRRLVALAVGLVQ